MSASAATPVDGPLTGLSFLALLLDRVAEPSGTTAGRGVRPPATEKVLMSAAVFRCPRGNGGGGETET